MRAFLNGRLDLTQAEAVLNVIGARTAESLHLATNDVAGDLSRRLQPANAAMAPLYVSELRIQGRVVGLLRFYR